MTARTASEETAPDSDVLVVGAGPAGLVLALLLLRSGLRVTVVERSRAHERAFRGEILQPGAMALLDRLGVLEDARARGAHPHRRFRLVERDRVLLDIDYRALPAPHDHLLSIPQPHVLDALLASCRRHERFRHLEGHRVGGLLRAGERVCGVRAQGPDGSVELTARVVAGADGRFSKVRREAGIDAGRTEAFDLDVLWFKLDAPAAAPDEEPDVRVFRAGSSPALVYRSWPDRLQIGWTLPHRGYQAVAAGGLALVKGQLARALPPYAELLHEQVTSLKDLSLLDVFSGRAPRWCLDGLVLLGDAAHTHSPIGAQGINLAVQDAVLLHPLLVRALADGDTSGRRLAAFEEQRAPDIAAVHRTQVLQSKAMLSHGPLATRVRPAAARLLRHTPVYRKILDRIAYGNRDVRVAEELFTR